MVVQDDKKAAGKALGMIVPYFVTIMLFAGAMGLGVDSIAGEKERGTMANLLISPVKRSEIIMGKVTGLGIVSILSAIVYVGSMAGVMLFMTKQSGASEQMQNFSINLSAVQIIQLVIIILGITFLYVALIGMVSVIAKNIKEAQSLIMPLYIVVMVAGMSTMFAGSAASTVSYAIPLYNTSVVFKGIFSMDMSMTQFIIAAAVTYGTALLVVGLMTKAIKSEKLMFNA
jgi:sodium transport system permease protein